ncbi:DUF5655 domain-containing protein [Saccharopolyspora shandongensis]|uniref:DUF5655 domain-containing protein n=1 Tax=Saccharopolyspora shandongensis TaxID=418495 RepID=UPI0033DF7CD7
MTQRDGMNLVGWQSMMDHAAGLLEQRTGADLAEWKERVAASGTTSEPRLRAWLGEQGVGGYSQDLLVYETYGYPEFMRTDPAELIDEQFADRQALRPVFDELLEAVVDLGVVTIQARKTYVSLVSPKRTFAIVKPSTKSRLDIGLHLPGRQPAGRLLPAKSLPKGNVRIALTAESGVDDEVVALLRECYEANS